MYLSQLVLEPGRETYRLLGDIHALHRLIMRGFPQGANGRAREEFGVLFRIEPSGPGEPVRVLVQSRVRPDWPELEGIAVLGPKPLDRLLGSVGPGSVYRFRLRANPTRRVHPKAAEGKDEARGRARAERPESVGKRVAIYGDERRLAWLARQAAQHGFRLLEVEVGDARLPNAGVFGRDRGEYWIGERRGAGSARRVVVESALFEGVLEVTDPERFRAALERGIGPAKAFGCGLLSIAPFRGA